MAITDEQLEKFLENGDGVANFAETMYIPRGSNQPIRLLPHQKKILSHIFTKDANGKLPYRTVVWSTPKKQGKTELAGLVGLYWSLANKYSEIYIATNSYEQSISRCFDRICRAIENHPDLRAETDIQRDTIRFRNGSTVKAVSSSYESVSGGLVALALIDELAYYVLESDERLLDELQPVPTLLNSLQFITSTAGFLNESKALYSLYERAVLTGKKIFDDLPLYTDGGDLLYYYEEDPCKCSEFKDGITAEFLESRRKALRQNQYRRLWLNQWVSAESTFVTLDEWKENCENPELRPSERRALVVVSVDCAVRRDYAAVVLLSRLPNNRYRLVEHRLWKKHPIDLSSIEKYILDVSKRHKIWRIVYDPHQWENSAQRLARVFGTGRVVPFPQTTQNLTMAGSTLYELIFERRLECYPDADFREQIGNTVAVERPDGRGFRLAKEKTSRKIDLIAALSFATVSALEMPVTNMFGLSQLHCIKRNPYYQCPILGGTTPAEECRRCETLYRLFQNIETEIQKENCVRQTIVESVGIYAKTHPEITDGIVMRSAGPPPKDERRAVLPFRYSKIQRG